MERVLRTKIFKNEPAVVKPGAAVKVVAKGAADAPRALLFVWILRVLVLKGRLAVHLP